MPARALALVLALAVSLAIGVTRTGPTRTSAMAGQPPQARPPAELLPSTSVDDGSREMVLRAFQHAQRPIAALELRTRPTSDMLPTDYAREIFALEAQSPLASGTFRLWPQQVYAWSAPALCHGPIYFEDINLERYGYSWGLVQPALSAAHFFGRTPALPYFIGAQPPRECVYTLGEGRPGSHVPPYCHRPPVRLRGVATQAAAVTGLIFALP